MRDGACSLVGLLLELGGAVGESNIEFFGSLHDGLPTQTQGNAVRIHTTQEKQRPNKRILTWSWLRR